VVARSTETSSGSGSGLGSGFSFPPFSCYVHTNNGKQLTENGAVLVDFGSTGLDRSPEESCKYKYLLSLQVLILSGLSAGRHRLVITPVGPLCTDVKPLPFTFNI